MHKNKHVVIAMIMAPILAVIAYFAVDSLVAEKPQAAQAGGSYALASLPNCRYPSGGCTLKNSEFKLELTIDNIGVNVFTLKLESKHPLQGAKVAFVENPSDTGKPIDMQSDNQQLNWSTQLEGTINPESKVQLVVAANDAFYYGQAELVFSQYETSFGKDFR